MHDLELWESKNWIRLRGWDKDTGKAGCKDILPLKETQRPASLSSHCFHIRWETSLSQLRDGEKICSLKLCQCKWNIFLWPARARSLGDQKAALISNPSTKLQIRAFWTQRSTCIWLCSFRKTAPWSTLQSQLVSAHFPQLCCAWSLSKPSPKSSNNLISPLWWP